MGFSTWRIIWWQWRFQQWHRIYQRHRRPVQMSRLLSMALPWLMHPDSKVFLNSFLKKGNLKFSLQERVLKRPGGFHLISMGDKTHQSETLKVCCWFPSHSSICCSWTMIALVHQGKWSLLPSKKLFTRQSYKALDLLTISISREALFVWQ